MEALDMAPVWFPKAPNGDLTSSDQVEGVNMLLCVGFNFVWFGETNFVVMSLPSFTMIRFLVLDSSERPFKLILTIGSSSTWNQSDGIWLRMGNRFLMFMFAAAFD